MNSHSNFSEFYNRVILKPAYEEIDTYPFMKTPVPTAVFVVVYALFVLVVGPAYMKNKKPYTLRKVLIVYNALQVIFSIYLFEKYTSYILKYGLVYSRCYMVEYETRQEILYCLWLYYVSKLTELIDTVFFVLRKKNKQISYLHVHHHLSMYAGSWAFLKYTPSDTVASIGSANAFVHVFMYTYYGLSAMGPHMAKYLTWKRHMTTMQLIQFLVCPCIYVMQLIKSECPPSKLFSLIIILNNIMFLYMFGKFYYVNYMKNRKINLDNKKE